MNSCLIQKIDKAKILPLSKRQFVIHYFIAFIPLIVGLMDIYWVIERWNTENYINSNTEKDINSLFFWFSLALIIFVIKRRRLNFHRFDTALSVIEFKQKMSEIAEIENWRLNNKNGKSAIFFNDNSGWNWGLKITILRFKNYLLINSVCDYDYIPCISLFGNELNIKRVKKHLKKPVANSGYAPGGHPSSVDR